MANNNDSFSMSMFSALETSSKDLTFVKNADLRLVQDDNIEQAFSFIEENKSLAFDIESSGLSFLFDVLAGFSIATNKTALYFPFNHKLGGNITKVTPKDVLSKLTDKRLLTHHGKFDIKFIKHQYGIDLPIAQDTFLMMALIDSDRIQMKDKLGLKHLVWEFLKIEMLDLKDDLGTTDFTTVPVSDAVYYAGADTLCDRLLFSKIFPRIKELGLEAIYQLELDILPFVAEIEMRGVRVDVDYIVNNIGVLDDEVSSLKKRIEVFGDNQFDVNSPAQCATLLYDHLKLPAFRERSVDVRVLEKLKERHEVIPLIINYSELRKLSNAFFSKIRDSLAEDGRLHSEFNQTGTRSGRFSSSGGFGKKGIKIDINLQQLPKTEVFNIRKAFTTEDGYYFGHADYSQVEYRGMAALSKEKSLIDAYIQGVDFHVKTAAEFLGIPIEKVTSDDRKIGKILNFAVSYGMSKYGLANSLGKKPHEAEALLIQYFSKLPNLKRLIRRIKEEGLKNEYVKTFFGRIRWFRNPPRDDEEALVRFLRSMFNTFIQGTAADIVKMGMRNVYHAIRDSGLDIRCILTVHDELNFEVHKSIPPSAFARLVQKAMLVDISCKELAWGSFPVEVSVGPNFGEQKDLSEAFILNDADTPYDNFMALTAEREAPKKAEAKLQQKFSAIKPSLFLDGELSKKRIDSLKQLIDKNSGLFRIYVNVDDSMFLLNDTHSINATPFVLAQLKELGFEVKLYVEQKEFNLNIDELLK